MTKRGLMIEGEGRYLFEPAVGEIIAQILPYDRVADTSRWAFSWKHNQQLQPWLTGYFNYNRVSDSNYFADFSDRIAVTLAEDAAAGGRAQSPTYGPLPGNGAGGVVPDAAGPRCTGDPAVQHAAAGEGDDEPRRIGPA